MTPRTAKALAALMLGVATVACGADQGDGVAVGSFDEASVTPTVARGTPNRAPVVVDAPIVDAQIVVFHSDDFKAGKSHNRISLRVISRLPTTCTEFESAEIVAGGRINFQVHVTNRVFADPGPPCPASDATHLSDVFLGDDLPYADVTAEVNDRTVTFAVR